MTPTRITLSRAKGWRKPEGAIVVSRPSIWGNPWKPGKIGFVTPPPHADLPPTEWNMHRELKPVEAVSAYEIWLDGYSLPVEYSPWKATMTREGKRLVWDAFAARRTLILSRLPELCGHDLCCWCKPGDPCHGDILILMANA